MIKGKEIYVVRVREEFKFSACVRVNNWKAEWNPMSNGTKCELAASSSYQGATVLKENEK